ncbi:hypothetical protein CsSME_00035032 [Camellia sinensis var. sinensis]
MEEAKAGAGESVRASSSLVAVGGRQRFTVELRPGETTIVSWKKLAKDVSKVNRPTSSAPAPAPAPEPQSNAHSALESRLAPSFIKSLVDRENVRPSIGHPEGQPADRLVFLH